jgi:hypothetical protein
VEKKWRQSRPPIPEWHTVLLAPLLRRPRYLHTGRSYQISTAKLTQLCGTTNRARLRDAVEVVPSQEALRVINGSTRGPSLSRFASREASLPT